MSDPISFIPAPKRVRGKRRLFVAGPPTAANQITLVKHGDAPEQLLVFLSEPLSGYGDFHLMLGASVAGELWFIPVAMNADDPTVLVFTMNADVSLTTMFRVPGPANYHFAGGGTLAAPFNGEIV